MGPEEVRGSRVAPAGGDHLRAPGPVDDDDIDGIEVVDRQAVFPGQQPVPTTDDVAAEADRVAGTAGDGDAVALVQHLVHVPVGAPALQADGAVAALGDGPHAGDVDDHSAGIVGDEALVAVAAAADGDPAALVDRGLNGPPALLRRCDHGHVRWRADEALVEAGGQGLVTRIVGPDPDGRDVGAGRIGTRRAGRGRALAQHLRRGGPRHGRADAEQNAAPAGPRGAPPAGVADQGSLAAVAGPGIVISAGHVLPPARRHPAGALQSLDDRVPGSSHRRQTVNVHMTGLPPPRVFNLVRSVRQVDPHCGDWVRLPVPVEAVRAQPVPAAPQVWRDSEVVRRKHEARTLAARPRQSRGVGQ
jgi:hypothetical protein